jgi:hypothetical protein
MVLALRTSSSECIELAHSWLRLAERTIILAGDRNRDAIANFGGIAPQGALRVP